ncbi:E3 ubiquitin-protein ligase NRDP1-like protein [Leptotrombidium deliense]|uniref:E3 ubiquitin-protein ligase NRDP1-like protein n=1 Tax=Leptotrombidium deliense TaxID=299467 RepID=A0A443S818_9ACAR|nr:E3 ubiquitin-protein ligase NRDP1-like protein [Leptotrombidium deliense]
MGFKVKGSHKEPYKDLLCQICKGVFEEPMVSNDCKHIFCKECLNKKGFKHFKCPIDGKDISAVNVNSNIPESVKSKLNRVIVKCRNNECKTRLKLCDIRTHELHDCWFSKVECRRGCGKWVKRIDERIHDVMCAMELSSFETFEKSVSQSSSGCSSPAYSPKMPSKEKKFSKDKECEWNIAHTTGSNKRKEKKTNCVIQ